MDHLATPSLGKRLRGIGIKKSYAYMLASGDRTPPMPLALRIHEELGVKLGPIASATEDEIATLARMASREAAQ